MRKPKSLLIAYLLIFANGFSFSQDEIFRLDSTNLFHQKLLDSIERYLILNQDDVVIRLYIKIDPLSDEFISCLNCENNELKYLDINLMQEDFSKLENPNSYQIWKKSALYLIQINSIENKNTCKLVAQE